MKTKFKRFQARLFCAVALGIGSSLSLAAGAARDVVSVQRGASEDGERGNVERGSLVRRSDALTLYAPRLPWSQLGVPQGGTGADCQGDGLAVSPTAGGARLRCVFQRLEGHATREGLWLTSTVIPPSGTVNDRFRIVAAAVGSVERGASEGVESESVERGALVRRSDALTLYAPLPPHAPRLPDTGTVALDGQTVRFTRPGLIEEYTVSMDGVRQDFAVLERPPALAPRSCAQERGGELALWLAVSGARVESAAGGARLVLENSGRKIAYSRLRVTDATGRELSARMEVLSAGAEGTSFKS